jgi:hypothetical protein
VTSRQRPLFEGDDGSILADDAGHFLLTGRSGTGKTMLAAAILRAKLADPRWGVHVVDPDGDLTPLCLEFLANPRNAVHRTVHLVRPASSDAIALPLLHVADRSPQSCHEKSVRTVRIFAEACGFDHGELGPRLQKFFYLGCLGLSLTGRSLVDLPELYSHGAKHLREVVAAAYPYEFLAAEMRSLDLLSDRVFAEYRDPIISRLMPIFGNPQLRRVFGPQRPLDLGRVLAARECTFVDATGLEHADARLVGNAFNSLFYHEAMQRPPNQGPHALLLVDEAFDYLEPLARGFDRLRKRNVQLGVVVQRLAQLSKAVDEDRAAMLSAAITNTDVKVWFGGMEPEDCDLGVRVLFAENVDLQEWKERSSRPVAIGQRKEVVRSRSCSEHAAEHELHSVTFSHATGHAVGTMVSTGIASGEFSATGDSAGLVMQAPAQLFGPSAPGAQMLPVPLTQSTGDSRSHGSSDMTSRSEGTSDTQIDMRGQAESVGRGRSRGTSVTEGESETFVTDYEWMPQQMYSLPEQLFRLAGVLASLPRRECFVKIRHHPPFRTRTTDVSPAFSSSFAKRVMLPIFADQMRARSPYVLPASQVDAHIAARLAVIEPAAKPEPDFSAPAPLVQTLLEEPKAFAAEFWRKRATSDKPPKPRKPKTAPGRRPVGDLDERHGKFLVVDGDLDGGDKPK